jgi:hypothetical protein
VLRINAARISVAMAVQPLSAGFLEVYPDVQVELTNDEGDADIVEGLPRCSGSAFSSPASATTGQRKRRTHARPATAITTKLAIC